MLFKIKKDASIIKQLIDSKSDVNFIYRGAAPAMIACRYYTFSSTLSEIVKLLLRAGADMSASVSPHAGERKTDLHYLLSNYKAMNVSLVLKLSQNNYNLSLPSRQNYYLTYEVYIYIDSLYSNTSLEQQSNILSYWLRSKWWLTYRSSKNGFYPIPKNAGKICQYLIANNYYLRTEELKQLRPSILRYYIQLNYAHVYSTMNTTHPFSSGFVTIQFGDDVNNKIVIPDGIAIYSEVLRNFISNQPGSIFVYPHPAKPTEIASFLIELSSNRRVNNTLNNYFMIGTISSYSDCKDDMHGSSSSSETHSIGDLNPQFETQILDE